MHDHIPEILYGGSAGGGKSDGLLMAALQYVHVPGYAALLLRRTYADLALPGAIMDRSHEWLEGRGVHWSDEKKTWTFRSGATITFGYLEAPRDHFRYQSSEFQFVGFDEVTQFREPQYRYLHSRLRRLVGSDIPIRMRAASNPGDIGHDWVKARFIDAKTREKDCLFIPATLEDNPHLDRESYLKSLMKLDPVTREQLLNGNWDIRPEGGLFKQDWFKIVERDEIPAAAYNHYVRRWDLAATEGGGDYTCGLAMCTYQGIFYVVDLVRGQMGPAEVEESIGNTASQDRAKAPAHHIRMEQEPGASGKSMIDHYARKVLVGYRFRGAPASGSKIVRAQPASAAASNHMIRILRAPWNEVFLSEVAAFPTGAHDDIVDVFSGAYADLTQDGMMADSVDSCIDTYV